MLTNAPNLKHKGMTVSRMGSAFLCCSSSTESQTSIHSITSVHSAPATWGAGSGMENVTENKTESLSMRR